MLLNSNWMGEVFSNPGSAKEFLTAYTQKVLNYDPDLGRQNAEQMQRELRNFLVENHIEDPGKLSVGNMAKLTNGLSTKDKGQFYNQAAPGAVLDKNFTNPAEFFQAIWHKNQNLTNYEELKTKLQAHQENSRKVRNAAGSNVPSDGGFLIPEILRSDILTLTLPESVVRPRATVIPMDSLKVPIPAVDEKDRSANIFGGIVFYWTSEGGIGQDTSAKFQQVTLDAKKLFGYTGIPNELLADSRAFVAWFAQQFPKGIAWFEDISFLGGDGTDKPLGAFKGDATIAVARNTTGHIKYQDIVAMFARMYPSSIDNSVWVVSPDTFTDLAELSFSPDGTNYVPVMLWLPNAVGKPIPTLLGQPVIRTEKAPAALGSQGDISLVDFSQYLIGDRQAMSLESSSDYLFGTDKTAFKVIERVDGRPWWQSALTPHNGSATLSPYIQLAT